MKWYSMNGPEDDVVISTGIRLARNIADYPFPVRLDREGKKQICRTVKQIFEEEEKADAAQGSEKYRLSYTELSMLTPVQAVSLAERNLISADFISKNDGALLLSEDESLAVSLCGEDHIRMQVLKAGLDLQGAYERANETDELLEKHLHYAFDERLGYLTQCPTDLGTGMRASVMLHLPALAATGNVTRLAATVAKLGITLRSAYSDGVNSTCDIYRLSNRVTLGISETAAIENLKSIVLQIAAQERQARDTLVRDARMKDRICRAYGILKSAYMMTSAEYMQLYSLVKLGAATGVLEADVQALNELFAGTQPATLNSENGGELSALQRDTVRAEKIRNRLA